MTLNDLIRKANDMAMQLSSGDVPIYDEDGIAIHNIILSIESEDYGNDGSFTFVKMKVV